MLCKGSRELLEYCTVLYKQLSRRGAIKVDRAVAVREPATI